MLIQTTNVNTIATMLPKLYRDCTKEQAMRPLHLLRMKLQRNTLRHASYFPEVVSAQEFLSAWPAIGNIIFNHCKDLPNASFHHFKGEKIKARRRQVNCLRHDHQKQKGLQRPPANSSLSTSSGPFLPSLPKPSCTKMFPTL